MKAYGAELILVSKEKGIEGARDLAAEMQQQGKGAGALDQFANPDNPLAHYTGTGPEIWQQTAGVSPLRQRWAPPAPSPVSRIT